MLSCISMPFRNNTSHCYLLIACYIKGTMLTLVCIVYIFNPPNNPLKDILLICFYLWGILWSHERIVEMSGYKILFCVGNTQENV